MAVICAGLAVTNTAQAETQPYIGVGADYATPHSGDTQAFAAIIAGATFDVWPQTALGLEAEFGQPVGGADDARQTLRLRGLATYDFGAVTGLAAIGINQYLIDGDTFGGQSVGLGVQSDLGPNLLGRAEFLRDFDDSAFGTDVTTARIAVFYRF